MNAPSTRDRLIDAAFRVVARDGLDAASVKAIAAEAGVQPGLLHYHFKTKDEVLQAAVARGLTGYLSELGELLEGQPPDKVLAAFSGYIRDNLNAHRDLFRVRLGLAVRAMNDPQLSATLGEANAQAQEAMARIFAAHLGAKTPSKYHRAIARTAKSSFEGLMLAWLSQPNFPMLESYDVWEEAVRTMIETE